MADVGIVIVTYNSASEVGACLDAALRFEADIVVVDNGSSDGTTAEVTRRRGVRLVANSTNRGFAAAVNQGFAVLNTTYVLLLNPDAVLETGLDALKEACNLPRAAGAGGRLVDARGLLQSGFMVRGLPTPGALILEALLLNRLWPGNPINRRYRGFDLNYNKRISVEQPAGAFMMIRRAVWEELGGFDEGFFPLWFEDVDFCRRVIDRGLLLYYEPGAVAKHTGGHSLKLVSLEMRRVYWYRSFLRYAAKHFRPFQLRAVCVAVIAGSLPRVIAESAFYRSLKPLAAYGKVMRLAGSCAIFGWRDEVLLSGPQG